MFIQTEATPNPSTIKFIPGEVVLETGTAQFNSKDQADKSPMALSLFDIAGVKAVFLGFNFISVTKNDDVSWDILKADILTTIMDHYVSKKPMIIESDHTNEVSTTEDDEIVVQIKELIETRVRPAVAQDGGDIIFHEFKNGVVRLEMHGACAGCPSSTITLKNGIENMLKHYVPEVECVEAVE